MNLRAFEKLQRRAKHGLILQEVLDTLGRWGLWFCPYIVYCETETPGSSGNGKPQKFEYRKLQLTDIAMIAAMEDRHIPESVLSKRFESGDIAVGAFHDDRLVAHTWANLTQFPGLGDSPPIRNLESDEAYLYGACVIRQHRGKSIMPGLRSYLYVVLRAIGKHKFYSVSVFFNRSARRFKEKLGARESELRFSINLFGRIHKDFRLRTRSI